MSAALRTRIKESDPIRVKGLPTFPPVPTSLDGFIHHSGHAFPVKQAIFEDGRGLVATRDIEEGEYFIQIPWSLVLTADRCLSEMGLPPWLRFSKDWPDVTETVVIAVWLHRQRELGKESAWHSYMQTLPKSYKEFLLLNDYDRHLIDMLPYPQCMVMDAAEDDESLQVWMQPASKLTRNKNAMMEDYMIMRAWMESCPHLVSKPLNIQDFAWGWVSVNTRTFHLPGNAPWANGCVQSMIPFADFLNHDPDCDTGVAFEGNSGRYMFRAGRSYKQGEEVFNKYGDYASIFTWIEYGFVNDKKNARREPVFVDVKHIQHLLNLEGIMIQEEYRLNPEPSQGLLDICNRFSNNPMHAIVTLVRMTRHAISVVRSDEAWNVKGWNQHCGKIILELALDTCDEALAWCITQQLAVRS